MSWRDDPIAWVTNQINGTDQQAKNLEHMRRDVDPQGPAKVAQEMMKRDQAPRVINMPDWMMLHFDPQGKYGHKTFSSVDRLNPTPVPIANGNMVWEFPGRGNTGWSALTVGIDVNGTGELCYSGACAPRAVTGATGGVHDFDTVVDDMQNAFVDPYKHGNDFDKYDEIDEDLMTPDEYLDANGYLTFKGNDGPSTDDLEMYFSEYNPQNGLNLEFKEAYIPKNVRKGTSKGAIKKFYGQIAREHPRSIVFVDQEHSGLGHAISYYNGLQQAYHPFNRMWDWNTKRISHLYVPRNPNETLSDMMRNRGY